MATPLNIIPEAILLESIQNGLAYVKTNFQQQPEADSYLFKALDGLMLGSYNFYEQARQLIINEAEAPRKLLVDVTYNMQQSPVPAIVITNTVETPAAGGQWLSIGQGYILPDDMGIDSALPAVYTRRKTATTSLVILSDKAGEVAMLYHFISGLILSLQVHLHLKGIESITIGGENSEYYTGPQPLFSKALILKYDYNFSAPAIPEVFN
ncbi:hypothetical protein [Chitinophaga arvensicola]|uniref:Uncharacterized protein n=1 Tax=Chitinophaga arvensicola TaxID=29529 RepID=A0A1I0R9A2_9BACT|nr:hypothetical protein [Chitinophaga arvensicola]SEW37394.1 hypothetical protein SAMN04488122_2502 [Chitinophaga arvensicola]